MLPHKCKTCCIHISTPLQHLPIRKASSSPKPPRTTRRTTPTIATITLHPLPIQLHHPSNSIRSQLTESSMLK